MPVIILISTSLVLFLLLKLLWIFAPEGVDTLVSVLSLPAPESFGGVLHAASPITYMFVHINFWHLLINSLWLGWFGGLLGQVAGRKMLIPLFMSGGVAGALCYMLSFALHSSEAPATVLMGSSAATLAVITATVVSTPNLRVTLAFIGSFPLKWIAAAGAVLFVVASLEMEPGQIAAHTGGIASGMAGALFIALRKHRHKKLIQDSARRSIARSELIQKARTRGYATLSRSEQLALFNLSRNRYEQPQSSSHKNTR